MPPHAVLVNTARGKIVDVDAAVDAVREGRLRGAPAECRNPVVSRCATQ
ncbi:MAG: NAD(P)-dependent oxidoreductase [Pseudomonadota bacterium]